MRTIAAGTGLLVALAVFIAVAMGAVVAGDGGEAEAETNASFGAEVSSFMQANAAEAEGEVDDGMFNAAMNRTEDPEERRQLIEQRQQRLEERQSNLEERRNGITGDDEVRDRALATGVAVGADRLERSANGTERAAEAAGLDTERLNEIRQNARDLAGSDVADLAGGLAGKPESVAGGSPSESSGNVADESPGVDADDGANAGQSGNADDRSDDAEERTDTDEDGSPEDSDSDVDDSETSDDDSDESTN